MYPTAAKLVAALAFAALAWWVTDLVKPNLPQGTPMDWLAPVSAAVGAVMGWRVMGRRAGRGYVAAAGFGLTTAVAIVFWVLLIWAGYEMLQRSMDLYYDGPVEALESALALYMDYALLLVPGPPLPSLAVGAVLCGALAEWVARRAS
ncbi:tellurium resistance protein [Rhodobacteraceae bacterium CCMM004]|nr:tellurium resistance protein [Rhodobacteraceae bacterium CCMM004]